VPAADASLRVEAVRLPASGAAAAALRRRAHDHGGDTGARRR